MSIHLIARTMMDSSSMRVVLLHVISTRNTKIKEPNSRRLPVIPRLKHYLNKPSLLNHSISILSQVKQLPRPCSSRTSRCISHLNLLTIISMKGLTPDKAVFDDLIKSLSARLDVYDKILSKQKYLAGDASPLVHFLSHIVIFFFSRNSP